MESRARKRRQGWCEEAPAKPASCNPDSGILPQSHGQLPQSTDLSRSLGCLCSAAARLERRGRGGPQQSPARSLARCRRRSAVGTGAADATLSGRPRPPRCLPPGSSPDARGPRPPGLSWQQLHPDRHFLSLPTPSDPAGGWHGLCAHPDPCGARAPTLTPAAPGQGRMVYHLWPLV